MKLLSLCLLLLLLGMACGRNVDTESKSAAASEIVNPEGYGTLELDAFMTRLDQGNVQLLDVRTPEECADGIIPGATAINVLEESFRTRIQELDKDQTVLVYCRSGNRSQRASEILVAEGFREVHHLAGGYLAYEEAFGN